MVHTSITHQWFLATSIYSIFSKLILLAR